MRDLGIEFISVFGLPPVDFPMDDIHDRTLARSLTQHGDRWPSAQSAHRVGHGGMPHPIRRGSSV